MKIPAYIKPLLKEHKIEVYFWGIRNLGKLNLMRINKPRISIMCQNEILNSDVITNARILSNFRNPIKCLSVVCMKYKHLS